MLSRVAEASLGLWVFGLRGDKCRLPGVSDALCRIQWLRLAYPELAGTALGEKGSTVQHLEGEHKKELQIAGRLNAEQSLGILGHYPADEFYTVLREVRIVVRICRESAVATTRQNLVDSRPPLSSFRRPRTHGNNEASHSMT